MIDRRKFVGGVGAGSAALAFMPASILHAQQPLIDASQVEKLDPIETMVRLRSRTDGQLSIAWLDAQREIFIDGDVIPFCRMFACVLTKFNKIGEVWEAETIEITYYCDAKSGELLESFTMPGASEPVSVPIYRTGPQRVRFSRSLDEWEEHRPATAGEAGFAPPSWVHLVRGVRDPIVSHDDLYLRADEYGRVYPDRSKPPPVYYREWIVWKGDAKTILETDLADVPSDYSYSALSSFRPWMQMGTIQGHTMSNGRGAKIASMDEMPPQIARLLNRHHPEAFRDPNSLFK